MKKTRLRRNRSPGDHQEDDRAFQRKRRVLAALLHLLSLFIYTLWQQQKLNSKLLRAAASAASADAASFSGPFLQEKAAFSPTFESIHQKLTEAWDENYPSDSSLLLTVENFVKRQVPLRSEDITVATHYSANQLGRLSILAKWWNGPMSVSVWCRQREDLSLLSRHLINWYNTTEIAQISVHVLMEDGGVNTTYPHNILRNQAMSHTESDYIISLDGDFIPTKGAHDSLWKLIQEDAGIRHALREEKALYILPVFSIEPGRDGREVDLPQSRDELVRMYKRRIAKQWHNPSGHANCDYNRWLNYEPSIHNRTYSIKKIGISFEPYFLAYKPGLPEFWTGFRGFGFDKQSFIHELMLKGYHFNVFCEYYVAHLAHPHRGASRSQNIWEWNTNFAAYLAAKYSPQGDDIRWLKRPY